MSRLISSTTMTVDGVTDVGEWYVSEGGHDRAARDQFDGAAGMLLGRKTYEGLAAFWPQQTGEWADMLNPLPLIDELRFWLHPTVCGEGARPYEGETVKMRLLDSTSYDSGVTLLRYARVGRGSD